MCRDNGITVLDATGTDLTGSVMGGVNGMLAEMDRDATVARLAAGKAFWRGKKRLEGQYHYGEHPLRKYDNERAVVARVLALHLSMSSYGIAELLNSEGVRTRHNKLFDTTRIQRILKRLER
jgi:DNA invertase Pin-like site-specific DNA recombinase